MQTDARASKKSVVRGQKVKVQKKAVHQQSWLALRSPVLLASLFKLVLVRLCGCSTRGSIFPLPNKEISVRQEDQEKINMFARKNSHLCDLKEQIEQREVSVL